MSGERVVLDWRVACPVVGMVHLAPLPGAPRWGGSWDEVLERAEADADALVEGGVDGVLVENFHDAPFHPRDVPPVTTAALTRAVLAVRRRIGDRPFGVNVLRNDARAALGVAVATGAAFVRINVHTGSMWTDQGLLTGRAHRTLRERTALGARVALLADVLVKHAVPPPGSDLARVAQDTWHRGLADGLIVSGEGTGRATDPARVAAVRAAVSEAPVWVGSGVDASNAAELARRADGLIVGTAFKRDGRGEAPVDPDRVAAVIDAVRSAPPR